LNNQRRKVKKRGGRRKGRRGGERRRRGRRRKRRRSARKRRNVTDTSLTSIVSEDMVIMNMKVKRNGTIVSVPVKRMRAEESIPAAGTDTALGPPRKSHETQPPVLEALPCALPSSSRTHNK